MRISDWSSDVCSSDLRVALLFRRGDPLGEPRAFGVEIDHACQRQDEGGFIDHHLRGAAGGHITVRSEEHTSELQSLMRISYAVFCLKKKKIDKRYTIASRNS